MLAIPQNFFSLLYQQVSNLFSGSASAFVLALGIPLLFLAISVILDAGADDFSEDFQETFEE